jgi:hypothetical protein
MNVLAQQRGPDNFRWFQVTFAVGDGSVSGWVREDVVQELQGYPCPPLP